MPTTTKQTTLHCNFLRLSHIWKHRGKKSLYGCKYNNADVKSCTIYIARRNMHVYTTHFCKRKLSSHCFSGLTLVSKLWQTHAHSTWSFYNKLGLSFSHVAGDKCAQLSLHTNTHLTVCLNCTPCIHTHTTTTHRCKNWRKPQPGHFPCGIHVCLCVNCSFLHHSYILCPQALSYHMYHACSIFFGISRLFTTIYTYIHKRSGFIPIHFLKKSKRKTIDSQTFRTRAQRKTKAQHDNKTQHIVRLSHKVFFFTFRSQLSSGNSYRKRIFNTRTRA